MNTNNDFKTSIVPFLSVRNGTAAIAFYKQAFGAIELNRLNKDDNDHIVAELAIGTARFFIGDESPNHHHQSPETLGGCTVRLELFVTDPDSILARAVDAGAKVIYPITDHPELGYRQGRMVDPFGHHWLIGKPL